MHGDTAQDVGVHVGEIPDAHQQIDHARRGVASGAERVFVGFDHDPGFGTGSTMALCGRAATPIAARARGSRIIAAGRGRRRKHDSQGGQPLFRSLLGGHCGSPYHGTIFPSAGIGVV
jgi:hypothetical protein